MINTVRGSGDNPDPLFLEVQDVSSRSLAKPPPRETTPREKRLLRTHWAGAPAMPADAPVYEGDRDVLGFAHDAEKDNLPGFCLKLYAWIAAEQQKRFGPWNNDRPFNMLHNSYKHIMESGRCPLSSECRRYAESIARREGKSYQTKMELKS